ncbi:hypothetical protein EC988_004116, partial [Linderina pennispora]
SITTLLATLEGALLGDSDQHTGSSPMHHEARKHARYSTSDTLSDMEMPGEPAKRRRNSGDSEELARRAYKNRRLSKTLSSQFARSLSMSTGQSAGSVGVDHSPMHMDGYVSLSSVSSCSSLSSLSPWSSDAASTPHCGILDYSGMQRALANPTVNRTTKAQEKSKMAASGGLQLASSMEMDSSDGGMTASAMESSVCSELRNTSVAFNGDVFSVLFRAAPRDLGLASREEVDRAVEQWAEQQADSHGSETASQIIAGLQDRLAQLEARLPAILRRLSCDHRQTQPGERLDDLYRAVGEVAHIGGWLYRRQFPYLPAFFPSLAPQLPLLQELIRLSHISNDMQQLVAWTPKFSRSLKEMCNEYEELVQEKREVFGDMVSQAGLAWKAMGLPVDNGLIQHTQQWLESTTELCLARIARAYERRANSAAAFGKEDISIDDLALCSSQLIHSVLACSVLCGRYPAALASHLLYVLAEYSHWAVGKSAARANAWHGKSLDSRAMRLMRQCETLVKLLAYVRATLGDRMAMDAKAGDAAAAALESLAASLVELSWSLAEILAAYRQDGRFANPSGTLLLFIDFAVRFARRAVDFGGRFAAAHQRLHRMQAYLKRLESALA